MSDLIARTDRSLVRAGARSVRHVVVTAVAPVADRSAERPPADVAFVLDRAQTVTREVGLEELAAVVAALPSE